MPRPKQNEAYLHLYIDKNILERAKQLIPNLSIFVESKLKEYVILAEHGLVGGVGWTGGDLNPRPSPCQGDALPG